MNRTHRHISWAGDVGPKTFSGALAMVLGFYGLVYLPTVLDGLSAVSVVAEARAEPRAIEAPAIPAPLKPAATVIDARESVDDWSCRAGC
jgi:hypothetical protein